jgi:hypothetical protein
VVEEDAAGFGWCGVGFDRWGVGFGWWGVGFGWCDAGFAGGAWVSAGAGLASAGGAWVSAGAGLASAGAGLRTGCHVVVHDRYDGSVLLVSMVFATDAPTAPGLRRQGCGE